MRVSEMMTPSPLTLSPDDSLARARDLMSSYDIRELPVLDVDELVGILTDRDLKAAVGPELYLAGGSDVEQTIAGMLMDQPVSSVMSREVQTLYAATPAEDACRLLASLKVGSMPVVDERNKLVGILSVTDVLSVAADCFAAMG